MDCAECDEAHEVGKQFVVAGCDTSEVFEFVEEPLDQVALLVEVLVIGMRPAAVWPWRDDRLGTSVENGVVKVFGIVGPIGDDEAARDPLDQGRTKKNLASMARAGKEAGRIAEAIGGDVQLGA